MALGEIIHFRITTSFKRRLKRVANIEFSGEMANTNRKISALGRKAMIQYIERREIELGIVNVNGKNTKEEVAA